MSKQVINLGTAPTGVGGDTPRSAFTKAQANFDELYLALGASGSPAALPAAIPIDKGGTGRTDGLAWGNLKGTLSNQTDLVAALATKITGSKQALVTASVLFAGPGPTMINNLNVASITKVTTGIYDINFATPMDHTSFMVVGMTCDDSAVQSIVYENGASGSTRTTGKVRIVTGVPGGSTRDFSVVNVIVVGGKN
jgi:hypothetical protein